MIFFPSLSKLLLTKTQAALLIGPYEACVLTQVRFRNERSCHGPRAAL